MNEGLIPNLKVLDPACKPEKTAHMSLKSFRTDKVDQINSLQLDLNKTSLAHFRSQASRSSNLRKKLGSFGEFKSTTVIAKATKS